MSAIEIDPARCGGQPCLRGRRLTIEHLIRNMFAGVTVEEYCDIYDVDKALVTDAVNEISDNIGEWIKKCQVV